MPGTRSRWNELRDASFAEEGVYCLECARRGVQGEAIPAGEPLAVLGRLRELADGGDLAARRLFFGIIWDEGRSILCYRCKRARPVRLTAQERARLEAQADPEPGPATTPSAAVGQHSAEGNAPPAPLETPKEAPAPSHRHGRGDAGERKLDPDVRRAA